MQRTIYMHTARACGRGHDHHLGGRGSRRRRRRAGPRCDNNNNSNNNINKSTHKSIYQALGHKPIHEAGRNIFIANTNPLLRLRLSLRLALTIPGSRFRSSMCMGASTCTRIGNVYVCVWLYIHIYMYTYMYIHINNDSNTNICILCIYVCIHLYVCVYIYTYTYVFVCILILYAQRVSSDESRLQRCFGTGFMGTHVVMIIFISLCIFIYTDIHILTYTYNI